MIESDINAHVSAFKGTRGIRRVLNASYFSMKGFASAWHHEAAFRQELVASVLLSAVAFWLTDVSYERILLLGSLLLVLIVELLNSAIEAVVDKTGLEFNELSGRAKDMGSAAVFVSLLMVVMTWSLVLL